MRGICDYPTAAIELDDYIHQLAENENKSRDELTKRYTVDEKEVAAFERGFSEGYEAGRQKGYAEGWDAAMKEAKKEESS
jgi:flagellar biosynthesis/type III secretory pathway protein FliH